MDQPDARLDPDLLIRLCRLELALHEGDLEGTRRGLEDCLARGANPALLMEWALQIHLFDGFPASIEALRLLAELDGPVPRAAVLREESPPDQRRRRGEELFRQVYGNHAAEVKQALAGRSPELLEWILDHGYGRVLSRPGLDPADREVLAVAILARKGWRHQLRAHLRGALACGADPDLLLAVLEEACREPALVDECRTLLERPPA